MTNYVQFDGGVLAKAVDMTDRIQTEDGEAPPALNSAAATKAEEEAKAAAEAAAAAKAEEEAKAAAEAEAAKETTTKKK